MPANYSDRIAQLQTHISNDAAFLLTTPSDIEYYTGFEILVPEEREAFLVITTNQAFLLHASFSPAPHSNYLTLMSGTHLTNLVPHLTVIKQSSPFTQLAVDKSKLFADEYEALQQLPNTKLVDLDRTVIWQQRMIKDTFEIAAISQASRLAAAAFTQLQPTIKPGVTEKELQQRLDAILHSLGSEKPAFPTIVAFGQHGALPHHQPTSLPLAAETAILIDFGATYRHYRSDMTRSWWFGQRPPAEFTRIQNLVDEAYAKTISLLGSGSASITAQDIDETARTFLSQAGFGQQFIHTTGHGVGLDIHEPPSLYWKNHQPITAGMVITIEPGLYLTNQFGYRWENTVLVTAAGCQELTQ